MSPVILLRFVSSKGQNDARNYIVFMQVKNADRWPAGVGRIRFCVLQQVEIVPHQNPDVREDRVRYVAADEWADDRVVRGCCARRSAAGGAAETGLLCDARTSNSRAALDT